MGRARPGQVGGQGQLPARQGHLQILRPRGTGQKYPSADLSVPTPKATKEPEPAGWGSLGCHARGGRYWSPYLLWDPPCCLS